MNDLYAHLAVQIYGNSSLRCSSMRSQQHVKLQKGVENICSKSDTWPVGGSRGIVRQCQVP